MSTAVPPKLSILIVTWNVRDYTLRCLASVEAHPPGVPYEVVLVDNASEDGTVAAVRAEFPDVRVIENAHNVGFPRANNQALAEARGEYVLYLNPDTEVGPDAIAACVRSLDERPEVGVAGCRLVYGDGNTQLECARRPYLLRHLVWETFYLHMLFPRSPVFAEHLMGDWDHLDRRDVDALCGAFMLARKSAAEAVGGLPEEVFMYHEDIAFCLRMQRAGWRVHYIGDRHTVHHWRQSSRKSGTRLVLLEGIYKIQLIRETQGAVAAAAARAVFGVRCVIRLTIALLAAPLPARVRERYPRVFDVRAHARQLVWTIAPGLVRDQVPTSGVPA